MNRFFHNLKQTSSLLAIAVFSCVLPVDAQDFREPAVPGEGSLNQAFDLLEEKVNPPAGQTQPLQSVIQPPSTFDGFVPPATQRLQMQPISPRPEMNGVPGSELISGGLGSEPAALSPELLRQRSLRPGIELDAEGKLQPLDSWQG